MKAKVVRLFVLTAAIASTLTVGARPGQNASKPAAKRVKLLGGILVPAIVFGGTSHGSTNPQLACIWEKRAMPASTSSMQRMIFILAASAVSTECRRLMIHAWATREWVPVGWL